MIRRLILASALLAISACAQPRPSGLAPRAAETPPLPPPGAPVPADCAGPRSWTRAADVNASSMFGMPWEPYRRPEVGWEIYAPILAKEIGATCPPTSPAFAAALARWQASRGMAADGMVSGQTFQEVKGLWQERRPFIMATLDGSCPDPPAPGLLAAAAPAEGYGRKPILLRPAALAAFRRMRDAALAESPLVAAEVRADPEIFTLFSGFRDPVADEARCQAEGNCQGVVRARCSAHRTGLAIDIDVGSAPGLRPDSSADENRLFISRTATYRWIVANADRFGFANYVFEPWHWEWTREPVAAPGTQLTPSALN